jgi:hypothetical protein
VGSNAPGVFEKCVASRPTSPATVEAVMTVTKYAILLVVAVAIAASQPFRASAQEHLPIADPLEFNPDHRYFEPIYNIDLACLKPEDRANTGWFGTYDRAYLWVSNPDGREDYTSGARGWGNRYEIGYMLEEDNGWSSTIWHMGGPNDYDQITVTRLNQYNPDDPRVIDPRLPVVGYPVGDSDAVGDGVIVVPPEFANNSDLGYRAYVVQNSVNVMSMNGFELNKTWRLPPYFHGGILEPFLGFKYSQIQDRFQRQAYDTFGIDIDNDGTADFNVEQLETFSAGTKNDMFGGQIGGRYMYFRQRWTLSAEFRAFAMQNFQHHNEKFRERWSIYDTDGTFLGDSWTLLGTQGPVTPVVDYDHNDEFVFGFDLRTEAAYTLTKYIDLRVGFQMMDFGQGIWRGTFQDPNDQDVIMAGVTFGIAVNR